VLCCTVSSCQCKFTMTIVWGTNMHLHNKYMHTHTQVNTHSTRNTQHMHTYKCAHLHHIHIHSVSYKPHTVGNGANVADPGDACFLDFFLNKENVFFLSSLGYHERKKTNHLWHLTGSTYRAWLLWLRIQNSLESCLQ